MKRLLYILLLPIPLWAQQNVSLPAPGPIQVSASSIPAFVGETDKNSVVANALGTKNNNTCSTDAYCIPSPELALSGNLGIVGFQYSSSPAATLTVSDDKSDTYTCLTPSSADTSKLIDVCYFPNLTANAHYVTLGFGAAVSQVMAKMSMADNIATTSPVDTSSSAVGTSSTTANAVSITTTQANDYIWVFVCRTGTPAMTSKAIAGSGFTLGTVNFQDGCVSEFGVKTTAGVITPSLTWAPASTYIEYVVAFKTAFAGTAPSGMYVQRLQSWSTCPTLSACSQSGNFLQQFPSTGNLLLEANVCGTIQPTSITDATNTWISTGAINNIGGAAGAGNANEFYVPNASVAGGTQTVNTTGTGDCTFMWWDIIAGNDTNPFVGRFALGSNATTTTLMPAVALTFVPNATGHEFFSTGGIAFNTALSFAQPSSNCTFDAATWSGMPINGPEPVDQNNIWGHCVFNATGTVSLQFNLSASTSQSNDSSIDATVFLNPTGMGIINTAIAQATTGSSLVVTVPSTSSGHLLVVGTGFFDGATLRTVSSVSTGSTCGSGTAFTQSSGSTTSGVANTLLGTDIWYLLSAPAGVTSVIVCYSGATTNSEISYWEAAKGNGAAFSFDTSGKVSNGTISSSTATGASVTPSGAADFCPAHIAVTNAVSVNPKAGNSWVYVPSGGGLFNSGSAATSLLTTSTSATNPVWTTSTATGSDNISEACFK